MFDFLFDLTYDHIYYAVYLSYILSFSMKLAWVWSIEFKVIDAAPNDVDLKSVFTKQTHLNQNQYISNDVLDWLIKMTRRIEQQDDAPDSHSYC